MVTGNWTASRYCSGLTHLKNRATIYQKHSTDSQKPKRREHKHTKIKLIKVQKEKQKLKKKRNKEETKNYWKTRFTKAINTHLSVIPLNVNGLNAPIERCRVVDRIRKQEPTTCCLQMTRLGRRTHINLK